ncbi:hypothetical protein [Actinomadura geliboluensis]|uniref:hypothetical protein n=1 Tax=Actinomadura geliboluensis TaxID=882440 RepID=UPI003697BABC
MAHVTGVHGIRNFTYFSSAKKDLRTAERAISMNWTAWLGKGLASHRPPLPACDPLPVAYYADCLDRGTPMGADDPTRLEPFARQLFAAWVEEIRAARPDGARPVAVPQTGRAMRTLVKQPAQWLARHHGQAAVRLVSAMSAELATYFGEQHAHRREAARERVRAMLREHRPRILLAHSLGSVVTYEALCSAPDLRVDLLVTLGSPLGIANVVYERLLPAPGHRAVRPPGVGTWINIADKGDPVALPVGKLAERFEGVDLDIEVDNHPVDPHSVKYYLRSPRLAEALAPHLPFR